MLNRHPQMLAPRRVAFDFIGGYLFGIIDLCDGEHVLNRHPRTLGPRRTTSEPPKHRRLRTRQRNRSSSLTPTRLSVHLSELPEIHPPGLGLASLRITLGYGKNANFPHAIYKHKLDDESRTL